MRGSNLSAGAACSEAGSVRDRDYDTDTDTNAIVRRFTRYGPFLQYYLRHPPSSQAHVFTNTWILPLLIVLSF